MTQYAPEVAETPKIDPTLVDHDSSFLDQIASKNRTIIIEGIAGSGKDTFQAYFRKRIKNRDVYDYSEGEVLLSWKHSPIEGIAKLRIKFMQHFVKHISHFLKRDKNAVFLLNRFHLSTYVTTVITNPELKSDYDEIINILRTLPVHIFILRLDASEIEERSSHSERSGGWQKYQQHRVTKDGFGDRLERYLWQQKVMIDIAQRQQIPYSLLKFARGPDVGSAWSRVAEGQGIIPPEARMNASQLSPRKRGISRTV